MLVLGTIRKALFFQFRIVLSRLVLGTIRKALFVVVFFSFEKIVFFKGFTQVHCIIKSITFIQVDSQGNNVRKVQRSNDELQEQVENLTLQLEHLQSR